MIVALLSIGWVAIGLGCYEYARRSWRYRHGTDDAPANHLVGAILGPCAIGFVLAEIQLRREHHQ